MEMQKDSAFSAWLFLVKPHQRSILTKRSASQDIPVHFQKQMEMQK